MSDSQNVNANLVKPRGATVDTAQVFRPSLREKQQKQLGFRFAPVCTEYKEMLPERKLKSMDPSVIITDSYSDSDLCCQVQVLQGLPRPFFPSTILLCSFYLVFPFSGRVLVALPPESLHYLLTLNPIFIIFQLPLNFRIFLLCWTGTFLSVKCIFLTVFTIPMI